MLSTSHLAVNALFIITTFVMGKVKGPDCPYCHQKTVHGSFIKVGFFRAHAVAYSI